MAVVADVEADVAEFPALVSLVAAAFLLERALVADDADPVADVEAFVSLVPALVADVDASLALVTAVTLDASELVADVADAVALLAAAVALLADPVVDVAALDADVAALDADVAASDALVEATEALEDAAVADSAALTACRVTSVMVASVFESPVPPTPRYIPDILIPYLFRNFFLSFSLSHFSMKGCNPFIKSCVWANSIYTTSCSLNINYFT